MWRTCKFMLLGLGGLEVGKKNQVSWRLRCIERYLNLGVGTLGSLSTVQMNIEGLKGTGVGLLGSKFLS